MKRFTISLDDRLADEFDALISKRGYANRSEAVRDMLRANFDRLLEEKDANAHCVANLSYVYNHHERDMAERLTELQHAHHDLTVSTMHAHLDHEHCIESVILKGPARAVRQFANALAAERGVRHGQLNLVMVEIDRPARHSHQHLSPKH